MAERKARSGMIGAGGGVWRLRRAVAAALWLVCLAASIFAQQPAGSGPGLTAGQTISAIRFEGVNEDRLKPLAAELRDEVGKPLSAQKLRLALRSLYATGLYETVEAAAETDAGGVTLIFRGTPRMFIGTVSVDGAKGATMNTQLERAARLEPGTRYSRTRLDAAIAQMRQTLADNGYREPAISEKVTPHAESQLVDLDFRVISGPRARVGGVAVTGDVGLTTGQFRRAAGLRAGSAVSHDTVNRAVEGVLKRYEKEERLEADVKLQAQQYTPKERRTDYLFTANRGPKVEVTVSGASIDQARVKRLVPIYEEGSVDEDLLNEGNRRLRDYFQRLGYFDARVAHEQGVGTGGAVTIHFNVDLGERRRVEQVRVTGNIFFREDTLRGLLSVHPANTLDRQGAYSQEMAAADAAAIEKEYRNNGFAQAKVTVETKGPEVAPKHGTAPLTVVYHVEEGAQTRIGRVTIEGNEHMPAGMLTPLLNSQPGQLLSPEYLAGDRDALLTLYLSRGFELVSVEVSEHQAAEPANTVDVVFTVREGRQIFIRDVHITGVHYTRDSTIAGAMTVQAGDPLNQTALQETQRNLYEFALFNEVRIAVQNPDGDETYKTVLLQAIEARRWTLTYGFGFEAQTGQPENNCKGATLGGVACNPNGKTGVSPRVIASLTRSNVMGREHSASLEGTYGLLEQHVALLYQIPHFVGYRNVGLMFSVGYANSKDVTTYVASRLDGAMRWTQSFRSSGAILSKANTLVYEMDFRRVKVAASSLQVFPGEIAELSTAVRVSGPAFTWIRDTRDSPLEAHRGTYTSFQEFLSSRKTGAEAQFNRIDLSNSSYYEFGRGKVVLARNTRYGQVRAIGAGFSSLIPLPERLYAGGATSMRGYSQNAAGPRDPETGYPVGGAGTLINSTELRLPPTALPWLGNSMSVVLFHDMGNVFANAGDAWASFLRVRQPDRETCRQLATVGQASTYVPTGQKTSTGQQGACSFNYFSHAPGIGLRYHTPVGPIRFDFSYNLNPPIYPVNIDYSLSNPFLSPHVGQGGHFNFFFSLGQTF